MPKVFISTLGFTETTVLAPIVRIGLNRGDKIIALIPEGLGDEQRISNTLKS
jgi:hypothetical protein